jgi:hypothetical protein
MRLAKWHVGYQTFDETNNPSAMKQYYEVND